MCARDHCSHDEERSISYKLCPPSVMADCDGMSMAFSFKLCTYLTVSIMGIRKFRPCVCKHKMAFSLPLRQTYKPYIDAVPAATFLGTARISRQSMPVAEARSLLSVVMISASGESWKWTLWCGVARTKFGGGLMASSDAVADRVLTRTWVACIWKRCAREINLVGHLPGARRERKNALQAPLTLK